MNNYGRNHQRGAVLIIALVFLALIALISVSSMDSSRLEAYMAGNEQARVDALQRAQAVVDLLGDEDGSFRVTSVGYLRCNSGNSDADCDSTAALAISNSDVAALVSGITDLSYTSEFYYESTKAPPASIGNGSGQAYGAAYFDVKVLYDNSDNRGGRAQVSQGIGVRVPTSQQGGSAPAGTDGDTQMQLPVSP
ncbi:hypothetical protein G8770_05280 [Aestuariicella hydrocarbonica]|uniref:Type 4 fimbrial biogenesis protein PilX N-terminal domain-containing protein n=1 Tax=Pseudomaricurvus hydrocarbonicus TaxID=1470433 RepID=A0A9E5JZ02_9GAMM|nr:PilX N-terminal domain-containing pilus assembly protein [Aestuariicella hydrocarbonica]NHO64952.1 hypothetical protein [Aestuariicella hydrocarbonica]